MSPEPSRRSGSFRIGEQGVAGSAICPSAFNSSRVKHAIRARRVTSGRWWVSRISAFDPIQHRRGPDHGPAWLPCCDSISLRSGRGARDCPAHPRITTRLGLVTLSAPELSRHSADQQSTLDGFATVARMAEALGDRDLLRLV